MYETYGKRFLDIVLSMAFILMSSWLLILIICAYIITVDFPIFFLQSRVGKDERVFDLIKFRTLKPDGTTTFALGNFLRFTSLDELPQLFQVLSGKLSLIGPRPLPVEYLAFYSAEQRRRHKVLPGITGWAQVNGRHSISWQKKLEMDNYYADHISAGLDFRIFIKTIGVLLSFKKDRSLEEQKFTGN